MTASLDFNQPKKDAKKKWEVLVFLGDNLTWTTIDSFLIELREARAELIATGVLDPHSPEHLKKELEELYERTPKNSKAYRVIYGDKYTTIRTFDQYCHELEREKSHHRSPGERMVKPNTVLPIKLSLIHISEPTRRYAIS